MTQHKDSNADDKPQNPKGPIRRDGKDDGDYWGEFLAAHQDDLGDVASSSTARKFERKVQRDEKHAALKASDLDRSTFVGGGQGPGRGPRNFSSSWLDTDEIMDRSSDFTPPDPALGPMRGLTLLYSILTVVGILGLVLTLFIPHPPSVLGPVFGLCSMIGIAGLIAGRGDFHQRRAPDDDGARV
ncbi:hypothetical protein [Bifidobacterium xylocopae]|uniref:Membrane associated protein n=1 Tax=Bifidobacterium xylocopae TaxID=2493119 RepID=A0A366KCV9_9BIFI|nr:hypothetical protein [Bifidobacterium xylocopae]RBP99560.1 hypothetical protein CRD59_03265 [Bifidobacterium xylocopae]